MIKYNTNKYCIDCGVELSKRKAIRCIRCRNKGKLHYKWVPKPTCRDCGKIVSKPQYTRCRQCLGKFIKSQTPLTYCINCGKKTSSMSNLRCISCSNKFSFKTRGHTEETKRKLSLAMGGTGIPRELSEYGAEFDNSLRELVRFRDKYTCQLCGCSQVENGKQLDVHHIDSNKKNNNINNLIGLCMKCHRKVGGKTENRKKWEIFFTSKEVIENETN